MPDEPSTPVIWTATSRLAGGGHQAATAAAPFVTTPGRTHLEKKLSLIGLISRENVTAHQFEQGKHRGKMATTSPLPALYSTLATDPDLGEIVGLFVAEMPNRTATLRDRLAAGDWAELRRAAHQLKGAAGSYGFEPITPAAARLEDAIRESLLEEAIRQMVDELIALCNSARAGTPG